MAVWATRRPTNEHKSVASLLLRLSGLPANSCTIAFERHLHLLKVVLSWHNVWQHCMSGYCKHSGARFNKICVFSVKEQITLELA